MHNLAGFVILLLISLGMMFAIWAAVSKSLQGLLNQVVKLPDGTAFYLRTFLIGLLLAAAAGTMDTAFDVKAGDPFMEYVWKVASGLHSVCLCFFGFLLGYLVLITVLVAVLRARHEQ
ncbi:MAG: hypothetical protein ABSA41_13750 [Terriglobia bacterium]|jgi:hypothetical protein